MCQYWRKLFVIALLLGSHTLAFFAQRVISCANQVEESQIMRLVPEDEGIYLGIAVPKKRAGDLSQEARLIAVSRLSEKSEWTLGASGQVPGFPAFEGFLYRETARIERLVRQ